MSITLKTILAAATLAVCMPSEASAAKNTYSISSPDGRIRAEVRTSGRLTYSVSFNGTRILAPSEISLTLDDGTVFGEGKVLGVREGSVSNLALPATAYKKAYVDEVYNWLTIDYKDCAVEFRAFDNAVTYRFVSKPGKGEFKVMAEQAEFNFNQDWMAWVAYSNTPFETIERQFNTSFENYYEHINLSSWDKSRIAFMPLVVDAPDGVKVLITESDLYRFPGLFLQGDGACGLKGIHAPYPKEIEQGGHNNLQGIVLSTEKYLAKAVAGQSFPWRIVGIVAEDKELTNLDLVWLLGRPADEGADFSWVKPGKVAWDWWNDWNLRGVDFRSGINNATYRYYIDFASKYNIEYVILDEGWAENGEADLLRVVPEINLEELVSYARSKNVDLILWAGYKALDKDIEGLCKHFADMGIKGFKVDFMDRDDQIVVEFYEKVARACAKNHLLVDFHGAFKPSGMQRAYPNIINYEGVAGLEQMKWGADTVDQVTYDVTIPFIRMAAGSMDYTQGAMKNCTIGTAYPDNSSPMSQGTRCRQIAEYAVFDAPLTMLCDSPSNYMSEPECTEFIAGFPTVWDETVPVCGKIGEYVAIARRSGSTWYVGALTGWDARDLTIDLGFIGGGRMTVFKDGVNADRSAQDYSKVCETLPADGKVSIHMAPGGGWAARIDK